MTQIPKLLVAVARTDITFELAEQNGKVVWIGKCIHCNKFITIGENGEATKNVTVEHIVPQWAGGTEDLLNLAIACFSCNNVKGRKHDPLFLKNSKSTELIERLLKKRKSNWRDLVGN